MHIIYDCKMFKIAMHVPQHQQWSLHPQWHGPCPRKEEPMLLLHLNLVWDMTVSCIAINYSHNFIKAIYARAYSFGSSFHHTLSRRGNLSWLCYFSISILHETWWWVISYFIIWLVVSWSTYRDSIGPQAGNNSPYCPASRSITQASRSITLHPGFARQP